MSCCARCGQGICTTAGKIALNKVWHRNCFRCYNCGQSLQVCNAKIFYGEVFCNCCCPQETAPCPSLCKEASSMECCPKPEPRCCNNDENCPIRDVHSCSCIPACCTANKPIKHDGCQYHQCEPHCRPRSPKPLNYPPRRSRSPCCRTPSPCCELPPPPPPPSPRMLKQQYCCCPSCKQQKPLPPPRCCPIKERCRRCGEKVFAAEKVLTSSGAYHLGCFSCNCCCKSLCVKTMYEACGEIYCKRKYSR